MPDTTVSDGGLSSSVALDRLHDDGPNALPGAPRPSMALLLLGEFVHLFALMLWVAALLAVLAGMPQLGAAIVVVIVVNGGFSFLQKQRAERAAEQLGELLPTAVTVRRDGVEQVVDAVAVVAGDLVVLHAGDRVPADAILRRAGGCHVDESMLSGESVPRAVGVGDVVYGGTFLTGGEALADIVATGARTRLAGIAQLTAGLHRPRSPLAEEIHRVVRTVAVVAVGVGVSFFVLSLVIGSSARDAFLFAVGVTVALVPEGLLPTVTLSLAIGAQRMAGHQALVRNLEAVETLGSTTFICTDKTGTITRNEMNVVSVWTPSGELTIDGDGYGPDAVLGGPDGAAVIAGPLRAAAQRLARTARACSQGRVGAAATPDAATRWVALGDPMEAAIDALAARVGLDRGELDHAERRIGARFPFDPVRRRESVLLDDAVLVKGAPESVLPRCVGSDTVTAATLALERLAGRGLRVLAVAARPLGDRGSAPSEGPDLAGGCCPDRCAASGPGAATPASDAPIVRARSGLDEADPAFVDGLEHGLELVGLLAFEDPPRPEVAAAVTACRRAGIRLAMLTGDHPATAQAIAHQIGLLAPDGPIYEGQDLPEDLAVLGALLDHDGVVISRVAPEDKLRITRALQARGHVVAMTGDGVNDGPALQEADIGVAMGRSGTDVARHAADLVLLDDNFATIVKAVESGRSTFANIRRFLTYHLSDNVAELTPFVIWALSGGRFPLAIGVLQVLCLDIGTDLLPALALGAEPPGVGVLDGPPPRRHLMDGAVLRRAFGVLGATEAVMEMLVFCAVLALDGWRPGLAFPTGGALAAASGAAFTAVVLGQLANTFACRSSRLAAWRVRGRRNPLLVGAIAAELVLLAAFLAIGPIARQLGHTVPGPAGLALAALTAPAVIATDALHKAWRSRARRRSPGMVRVVSGGGPNPAITGTPAP